MAEPLKELDAQQDPSDDGYFRPTSLSYAAVHQVYVAKVESLMEGHDEGRDDDDNGLVLVDTIRKPGMPNVSRAFHRAGRRSRLHFDATGTVAPVNAAIVTCGGLCPGLNNVVRELVHCLHNTYHAHQVWGVVGGWNGFQYNNNNSNYPEPILLTNESVESIHHQGGSALKTSRGGLDVDAVLEFLTARQISHLYIIGGDGTHRGAYKVHEACRDRELNVAVCGVPKTIDNDIDFLDRSFGFVSAVEAAQNAIRTALVEARCTLPNGIGVIKLMGRSAGFLAAFAALGSGDVDAVLVPEVPIVLDGPHGILPHIFRRVQEKQHAVVVVAEGAGEELLGESSEREAGSGNKKLPPIAEYIHDQIQQYFHDHSQEARMKYVDPSYSVRSVPANAADSLYCTQLAQNAVHGCMNGLTGFSVGMNNNRTVYIPIPQLVATSPRSMDPSGPIWDRILAMTQQPSPPSSATATTTTVNVGEGETTTTEGGMEKSTSFPRLPEPTFH